MRSLLILLATLAFVSSVLTAPGKCPRVSTVRIRRFDKLMGLWWRPYRSQFNAQEPIFKCLSTEWFDLEEPASEFKVIDNNYRNDTNEYIKLIGKIYPNQRDTADWKIVFNHGMNVSAQILDLIEDKYIFMFVCEEAPDGNTHTQNGIIFTRKRKPSVNSMSRYEKRAQRTIEKNNLHYVNMIKINLDDCQE